MFASLGRPATSPSPHNNGPAGPSRSLQSIQTSYYPAVTNTSNLYTDRPIYRTGETVHIRAVVRSDDDGSYSVPGGFGHLKLIVIDDRR